jgi:ribosomal protein S18 acetylase RimI-like enzyme
VSTTGHLTLRAGTVSDAEEIEAVHWAGLEGAYLGRVPGWPAEARIIADRTSRWRQWLAAPEIDTIVAECQGRIAGFCTLRPDTESHFGATTQGEMPTLYVHPNYWRRGFGRRLCLEGINRARERGFSSIVLWVVYVNERARLFYERLGFRPDGTCRSIPEYEAALTAHRYSIEVRLVE